VGRGRVETVAFLAERGRERAVRRLLGGAHHHEFDVLQGGGRLGERRQQRLGHETDPRARVGQDVSILLRGQQRVERDRHDAGPDGAQKNHREIDRVEHHHGDAVLAPQSEPAEKIGEARRLAVELRIGDAPLAVDEGELVAAAVAEVAVEQLARGVVDGHGAHREVSGTVERGAHLQPIRGHRRSVLRRPKGPDPPVALLGIIVH
jgi:hypothetical protein